MCKLQETSYGFIKRVGVFSKWISAFKQVNDLEILHILDYGCGTGELLTQPLGHIGDQIVGAEPDKDSVAIAITRNHSKNVRYVAADLDKLSEYNWHFDVIICSEVLEHTNDPMRYLQEFRRLLRTPGLLILSVPNGHGPFEQLKRFERWVDGTVIGRRINRLCLAMRRAVKFFLALIGREPKSVACTLNEDSHHVQFFRLEDIINICRSSGFEIRAIRGRTLLCGPYVDIWLNRWPFRLLWSLNSSLSDRLPLRFSSDWMFSLRKSSSDI